ncbi:hypothetical protein AYI70_g6434 [Smittium culicis]|uniref:SCP domain-containing protein n=1 Tax=Smittium culicis TaxID=133412 RepID=A0A1R1XQ04_9FUNG|nr:hypothetical protein AYI70_g6434 [Smittium culicis]
MFLSKSFVAALSALLCANALPVNVDKRKVIEVVQYVTVYVNGDQAPAAPAPQENYNYVPDYNNDYQVASTTEQAAPTPEYQAPAPEYQAPAPEYQAPASTQAPAPTQAPEQDKSQSSSSSSQSIESTPDYVTMLELVNKLRASVGKSPLVYNIPLIEAAKLQSNYQNSIGSMTHSNSNYDSLISRFAATGATCNGCAENVAAGYTSVNDVFQGWVDSPGHYANLVGDYKNFGWAVVGSYWTQTFNV